MKQSNRDKNEKNVPQVFMMATTRYASRGGAVAQGGHEDLNSKIMGWCTKRSETREKRPRLICLD